MDTCKFSLNGTTYQHLTVRKPFLKISLILTVNRSVASVGVVGDPAHH